MNLLLPCVVLYLFYHSLHDRIALTQHCMDQVKEGTYEVIHCEEGSDEVGSMIRSYNLMIMRIRELIEVVYKNKEKQQNQDRLYHGGVCTETERSIRRNNDKMIF